MVGCSPSPPARCCCSRPGYYLPREDIVAPVEDSDRHTICPYKGVASYYTVGGHKDIAWYYPEPLAGVEPIKGLVAFWNERTRLLDHSE
jgi:uncharacterized protein (DUF427 family)